MALQDTPPLADPTTGRIPPYTQVLKQDPVTGTYKIQYDVKEAPPASALQTGLTTPTTTVPGQMYGTGTQDDEADTDTGTDAQTNINTAIATTQNRGGEGMGRNRDFGGISVGEQSIADLSRTLNPSNFESAMFAGITAMAPMALGGLIAAGSADAQRQAIREINRRAAAGTLGTNPDGSQVSDQALASLGQQIGNQYGLPGFTSALSNTAAGQIFAANLAPQSLTGEETFNVTNQMVNPVSQEQITRDFDQAMMLGFQENQEQNLRDVFAQDIARQTMGLQESTAEVADRSSSIGETGIAGDQSEGPQTGPGGTSGTGYGAPGNFAAANAAAQAMGFEGAVGNTNPNTGLRSAVTDSEGNPIGYGERDTDADADASGDGGNGGGGYDGGGATGPGGGPGPQGGTGQPGAGTTAGQGGLGAGTGVGGQSPGPQGQRGGDAGEGQGRIICTELYRQDLISREDYILDLYYTSKHLTEQHTAGYWYLAVPAVKAMRRSKFWTAFWKEIAYNRLQDIKWRLGKGKFNLRGRIYSAILEPLCYICGYFTPNATYKQLYEGEK